MIRGFKFSPTYATEENARKAITKLEGKDRFMIVEKAGRFMIVEKAGRFRNLKRFPE